MLLFRAAAAFLVVFPALAQSIPPSAGWTVSYENDVHPILAARCYQCHAGDSLRGAFDMATRETFLQGSEYGPVVAIGDSEASTLIEAVSGIDPEFIMPPQGEPLTDEQIGILRAWIDQGLVWDTSQPIEERWIPPLEPIRPALPEGPGVHGSSHPIDRFVAAYFEEHGITPPALISDHRFARRAALDVTGLLPTVDELDAFLANKNLEKRLEYVLDLLNRDRDYAEHWMSYWNDALRNDFVGTGYIDGGRKPITQWLYDALYYNRPYDQFARELIHPSTGSRGFTDGIVWRGVAAAAQQPPIQAANSISQVFLGVNLKCASCHDSFVDNWKLADSYGMANFYAPEPLELVRCDTPQGRIAETKFLWPELGAVDATQPQGARTKQLAALITKAENGRFTRTIVNRIWAELMGRGIVEPLDSMHRKPWNPQLLDWLATEFEDLRYDLRALIELIMTSRAYQLESIATPPDDEDYRFRGPETRRLAAEEFVDAIARITGVWQTEPKFNPPSEHVPGPDVGVRAWRIPSDPLTRALGRPNREQVVTRRQTEYTRLQALELTNGDTLAALLKRGAAALDETLPPESIDRATTLYLRALQRRPADAEARAAAAFLDDHPGPQGLEDLLWALTMLPEFQLIY